MPEEVAALSVRLEANIARFERNMQRASRSMDRSARQIERRAQSVDQRLERVGDRYGIRIPGRAAVVAVAVAAIGKALGDVVKNGEDLRLLEGRFKALTGSAERAGDLIRAAFGIGSATGASLDAIGESLTRFTLAAEAIGATDDQVVQLTSNILKLGQIGGGSQQQLAAGAVQLGQALASGVLRGDELNSILENMPLVAKAIAEGLGVGVGQLRQMGKEGELTARKVFDALLSKTDEIDAKFADLPASVSLSAGRMANAWSRFTAALDESLGTSTALAAVLDGLTRSLDSLSGAGESNIFIDRAVTGKTVRELTNELDRQRAALEAGDLSLSIYTRDVKALNTAISAALRTAAENDPRRGLFNPGQVPPGPTANAPDVSSTPPRRPFELGVPDIPAGGGTASRQDEAAAARLLDQLRERIELLGQEQQLAGKSALQQAVLTAAFEKQRIMRELVNAAARDNTEITPEMTAQAQDLADQFERESVALAVLNDLLEKEKQAQDEAARSAEDYKRQIQQIGDAITGAIQQADSFTDALKRVALALANILLQDAATKGSGSILGKLIGGIAGAIGGSVGGGGGFVPPVGSPTSSGPFAKGAAFHRGEVIPFARGGIVDRPTVFPMARGIGLMGEAGPEAILPLKRGPGGRLGVEGGGSNVTVQIINNTPAEVREERGTGRSGEDVRRFIIDEVNKATARGEMDKIQRTRFGIAPQRIKR